MKSGARRHWAALACALAGGALFQFFGNATRGYVDTASMWWWWVSQWIDPRAQTQHGWLILGISGWVFARNLRAGKTRGARGEEERNAGARVWPAGGAMGSGLALHAVGFVAEQTRISIVAALVFAWGVLALANRRWARAAAFPLGFMVFAIPLNVLDSVGFWLRMWVIGASTSLAHAAGIDVVRSGTQLFAPDGRYQYDVAAACSGVRSLMALTALSLLIGYLNFRSWRRRALMLGLCFPLTFLGNLLRIGSIIVAAQMGGQKWGERAHDVMGFGVFVVVLGGVLAAAKLVERWWPEKPLEEPGARSQEREDEDQRSEAGGQKAEGREQPALRRFGEGSGGSVNSAWRASRLARNGNGPLAIAGAVGLLAVGEMLFLAQVAATAPNGAAGVRLAANGKDPVGLPAFLGTDWIGRQVAVTAVEREILPADTGFSRRDYVWLQNPRHTVFVSIVLSGRDRTSIHRPEICLVGQGWTIVAAGRHRFTWPGGGVVPATVLRTERTVPGQGPLPAIVAYWFVNGDTVVATHWQRFLRDAWNRVIHGRVDRWAYVLVQADARDGEPAALARMQAVLNQTLPAFQRVK